MPASRSATRASIGWPARWPRPAPACTSTWPRAATLQLVAGGHRLAAALFGLPFGKLDAGAPADLIVLDYRPPTDLQADNLAGHLLFGIDRSHVRSVMVAGRWVMRERELAGVDAAAAFARARAAARDVWSRMGAG